MEKQQLIDKKEIYAELTDIFKEVFSDNTIQLKEETTANDIGSWNSLSHMLMITEIENRFSIKFKLREISRLNNVGTLVELIESRL